MKLQDILSQVSAPKGVTSIISGLREGDLSVIPHQKGLNATVEEADKQIVLQQERLDKCQSDAMYWSILGDLEYWKAIRNILEGARLVGEDNMPEVTFENRGLVVMDAIGEVTKFGEEVLRLCKEQASKN